MRTGRPNTLRERKDRPQGEGRVRAAAANTVNSSAAEDIVHATVQYFYRMGLKVESVCT